MPTEAKAPDGARMFIDYIRELDRGRIHQDLSVDFRNLIKAIAETGKGGKLTLTLNVKPGGKHDAETITIETDIKTQIPKPGRNASFFYFDEHFNLTRRDPRQRDLEEYTTIEGGRT